MSSDQLARSMLNGFAIVTQSSSADRDDEDEPPTTAATASRACIREMDIPRGHFHLYFTVSIFLP